MSLPRCSGQPETARSGGITVVTPPSSSVGETEPVCAEGYGGNLGTGTRDMTGSPGSDPTRSGAATSQLHRERRRAPRGRRPPRAGGLALDTSQVQAGSRNYLNSEVEPQVAIDPTNRHCGAATFGRPVKSSASPRFRDNGYGRRWPAASRGVSGAPEPPLDELQDRRVVVHIVHDPATLRARRNHLRRHPESAQPGERRVGVGCHGRRDMVVEAIHSSKMMARTVRGHTGLRLTAW